MQTFSKVVVTGAIVGALAYGANEVGKYAADWMFGKEEKGEKVLEQTISAKKGVNEWKFDCPSNEEIKEFIIKLSVENDAKIEIKKIVVGNKIITLNDNCICDKNNDYQTILPVPYGQNNALIQVVIECNSDESKVRCYIGKILKKKE